MRTVSQSARTEAWWITLALLAFVLAWDASGLDLPLARLAGSAQGFPWRDQWLFANVLHDGGRRLSWLVALALALGVWWPLGPLKDLSLAQRLQLAVTVLLAPMAVSLLKTASGTSCPWDLSAFGGVASYSSHWNFAPDGGGGHCFPAGHASAGFGLAGGYFAVRETDLGRARAWLAGATASGLALGLAQQWRGAHFMSHTLWSAFVCWGVALAVDVAARAVQATTGAAG